MLPEVSPPKPKFKYEKVSLTKKYDTQIKYPLDPYSDSGALNKSVYLSNLSNFAAHKQTNSIS